MRFNLALIVVASFLAIGCQKSEKNSPQLTARPASVQNHQSRPMDQPATTQPAGAQAVYTCPMHPEVTSDKPGRCPKCGMNLVKKQEQSGGQEHMDHSSGGGHMH